MIIDTDSLVAASEIARRAGVWPTAVSNWIARHDDFPPPALNIGRHRLWAWPDVQSWLTRHDHPIAPASAGHEHL